MDIKEIRQKGFELFQNTGRMPNKLFINRESLDELIASKDANNYFYTTEDKKTYFDDLEIIIDDSIENFEVGV
jgi:hypothetical protein